MCPRPWAKEAPQRRGMGRTLLGGFSGLNSCLAWDGMVTASARGLVSMGSAGACISGVAMQRGGVDSDRCMHWVGACLAGSAGHGKAGGARFRPR